MIFLQKNGKDETVKLTTILFDLDGTLLPMDNDAITKGYFKLLAVKLAPHGYEPKQLVDAIWAGTAAMVKNDGTKSNEEAFWKKFAGIYGEKVLADKPLFDEFYEHDFENAKSICGFNPNAAMAVHTVKEMWLRVALTTNPIFPAVATESRIRWAGLEPEDFELYTTYENIGYCKPNSDYYREIAKRLGVKPEQCLMVGNDVTEDIDGEQHIAHERIVTAVEADRDGKKRQIGNMKLPEGIHTNLRGQTQAVGGGNQFVTGERIDDGEAACALLKGLSLYRMGTGAGKDKDKLHKVMPMSRDMHIAKQLFHFDIAIRPYEVLCTQAGLSVLGRILLLQLSAFCLKGGASDLIQSGNTESGNFPQNKEL